MDSAKLRFISEEIVPVAGSFEPAAMTRGEPPLPPAFTWRDEELPVREIFSTWRSTKLDRGDAYLARHWFEFATDGGRRAVVYFDRHARRGHARWWLYTLEKRGHPENIC